MVTVREAVFDDMVTLLEWAAARHHGSAYAGVPFDHKRAASKMARLMQRDDGLMLVAERDGELVGGLGAEIQPSTFLEGNVAVLWSMYAHPARGGAAGLALIRHYVEWASKRASLVEANNSDSMDDESFRKIMQRVGFQRSGSHMHLEVQ